MWTISSKQHTATTTTMTVVEEENDNDVWECSTSGTSAKRTLFLKHLNSYPDHLFLYQLEKLLAIWPRRLTGSLTDL